tara:strand:- start:4036 stop:4581 length:546 start_codon:yes stop_codon:yes gene_type:complete
MASKQQHSYTPAELRNLWRTPDYVYDYLNKHFHFDIDLAANRDNAKCDMYLTEQMDSLKYDWHLFGKVGWLYPPYDDTKPWVEKAIKESNQGFTTVMLIPCFNGSLIWEKIYDNAEVINIIGRLSFLAGATYIIERKRGNNKEVIEGQPVSGNDSGSSIVVFGEMPLLLQHKQYIVRDEMR